MILSLLKQKRLFFYSSLDSDFFKDTENVGKFTPFAYTLLSPPPREEIVEIVPLRAL